MNRLTLVPVVFIALLLTGCKNFISFSQSSACGESSSETSPSPNCQGPPGFDSISPPVFYRFYRITNQNIFVFDQYLEVGLVDREPRPTRGQYFLVLPPGADPEIVYSAKVRMATASNIPDLQADISAWASLDGYALAESLGKVSLRNGSEVVFPDYSHGQKYVVKSSFRWIVFNATYRSAKSSDLPAESRVQIYMGYSW